MRLKPPANGWAFGREMICHRFQIISRRRRFPATPLEVRLPEYVSPRQSSSIWK
jgi:hypothetical protein